MCIVTKYQVFKYEMSDHLEPIQLEIGHFILNDLIGK